MPYSCALQLCPHSCPQFSPSTAPVTSGLRHIRLDRTVVLCPSTNSHNTHQLVLTAPTHSPLAYPRQCRVVPEPHRVAPIRRPTQLGESSQSLERQLAVCQPVACAVFVICLCIELLTARLRIVHHCDLPARAAVPITASTPVHCQPTRVCSSAH